MNTLLLAPVAYLLITSVPLLITDVRERRIPNNILLPVYPLWLVCATSHAVLTGEWWNSLLLPLLMAILLFVPLMALVMGDKLGMGDVKLFIAFGLSLSWKSLWVWAIAPATLIIAIALTLLYVLLNNKLKRHIALAPFAFGAYALTIAILFTN